MRLAHDQWRLLDNAMLAVDLLGELAEHLHVALGACLVQHALGPVPYLGRKRVEDRPVVDPVVPEFKIAHLGEATDALAVGSHDCAGCVGSLGPCRHP